MAPKRKKSKSVAAKRRRGCRPVVVKSVDRPLPVGEVIKATAWTRTDDYDDGDLVPVSDYRYRDYGPDVFEADIDQGAAYNDYDIPYGAEWRLQRPAVVGNRMAEAVAERPVLAAELQRRSLQLPQQLAAAAQPEAPRPPSIAAIQPQQPLAVAAKSVGRQQLVAAERGRQEQADLDAAERRAISARNRQAAVKLKQQLDSDAAERRAASAKNRQAAVELQQQMAKKREDRRMLDEVAAERLRIQQTEQNQRRKMRAIAAEEDREMAAAIAESKAAQELRRMQAEGLAAANRQIDVKHSIPQAIAYVSRPSAAERLEKTKEQKRQAIPELTPSAAEPRQISLIRQSFKPAAISGGRLAKSAIPVAFRRQ